MNPAETPYADLLRWLGEVDIYLLDQVMKGRIVPGMRLLEAGCGDGRNLVFFLRSGFDVWAVDQTPHAIENVRALAAEHAPRLPADRFRVESIEKLSFPDGSFDVVACIAALHFADDEGQFRRMIDELWRVLAPNGLFFARLASTIGIESRVRSIHGRRFVVPDGTERFLVDEETLLRLTDELGARLVDPIKTVNVQNERCMTTWVCRRRAAD
jgi:SAM-dependent methyltransferase